MTETREEFDLRVKAAETAHDVFHKNSANVFNMVAGYGNAAMRAPAIAAAGGIAGVLGFYSANRATLRTSPSALFDFNWSLGWFFIAVLLCVIAPGIAYLCQTCFVKSLGEQRLSYEHPFVHDTKASARWRWVGIGMQVLTIGLVAASIFAIVNGALHLMWMVNAI